MPAIKVLPISAAEIGLVHPVDGPLAADGSLWTLDAFTVRRLDEGLIRRFEVGADDGAKAVDAPKGAAPAAVSNTAEATASANPAPVIDAPGAVAPAAKK